MREKLLEFHFIVSDVERCDFSLIRIKRRIKQVKELFVFNIYTHDNSVTRVLIFDIAV